MDAFLNFPRILFGAGALAGLKAELDRLGVRRPLVISDKVLSGLGTLARVRAAAGGDVPGFDGIPENPTDAAVTEALAAYREGACDGIVAVGGGSVIDSGKALSILAAFGGALDDYRVRPERITPAIAPLVAVPTTAGTGSEATRGCGIHPSPTARAKSLRSPNLLPRVAVCDVDLTMTLPPALTAATGMDALVQCLEAFVAVVDNPVIDAIALDGARRVMANIEQAFAHGDDRAARREMMLAGLQGGLAIGGKGLGPAHALGNTFGDQGFRHGELVTLALPVVLEHHAPHAAERLDRFAMALGCGSHAALPDAIRALMRRLDMPATFAALGYRLGDLDEAAADAAASHFNRLSPHQPDKAEYRDMIQALLD